MSIHCFVFVSVGLLGCNNISGMKIDAKATWFYVFRAEDGGCMFIQNVGIYIPVCTMLQFRRPTSISLLWECHVSCLLFHFEPSRIYDTLYGRLLLWQNLNQVITVWLWLAVEDLNRLLYASHRVWGVKLMTHLLLTLRIYVFKLLHDVVLI